MDSLLDPIFARLGPRLFCNALGAQLKRQRKYQEWIDDGNLHVVLPGSGSPIADPTRAGPCAVVMAGGEYLVVDVGQGSYARQTIMGLPTHRITGVLLTHFHSDHIVELGETCTMSWAAGGRRDPLPVYGPPGIEEVVDGFRLAYERDGRYRVDHHGHLDPDAWRREGAFGEAVEIPLPGGLDSSMGSSLVLHRNGLKVHAFNVNHEPVSPAFGFRFEYNGRVAVVSGDCRRCPQLVEYSTGADVLVSEACSCQVLGTLGLALRDQLGGERGDRMAGVITDIQEYHMDVQDAVDVAAAARAPVLALTHLVPGTRGSWFVKKFWLAKLRRPVGWDGRMYVGEDGDSFHMKAFGKDVEYVNLLTGKSDGGLMSTWTGRWVVAAFAILLAAMTVR